MKDQVDKRVRNIITAGKSREEVIDGLFMRKLIEGLKGAADCNGDYYISFTELGDYVKYHVSEEARKKYNNIYPQHPQVGSLITEHGEIIFGRIK